MSEESDKRIAELEKRIQDLERELLHYRPLGPRPEAIAPDPEIVERLVESVKEKIAVDRSKRCTLHGMDPDGPEHREIVPETGMQKDYVVLCPDERAKGFVRPVRRTYLHKVCGTTTTMGLALAETYARDPYFYSGTFCCHCRKHRPLDEFVWEGTNEQVGT